VTRRSSVINLSTEKPKVVREMFRVLRNGGRLSISDVVAADELSPAERAEKGCYVGCIAGALSFSEYHQELTDAGFTDVSIAPTHLEVDQMYGAIIRAHKP
jgi:arsenite methyltransferase